MENLHSDSQLDNSCSDTSTSLAPKTSLPTSITWKPKKLFSDAQPSGSKDKGLGNNKPYQDFWDTSSTSKQTSGAQVHVAKRAKLIDKNTSVASSIRCDQIESNKISQHRSSSGMSFNSTGNFSVLDRPMANLNPFSSKRQAQCKRSVTGLILDIEKKKIGKIPNVSDSEGNDFSNSDLDSEQPREELMLQELNISRYHEEFYECNLIGSGNFGSVYKCINRLDGCVYALKRIRNPVTNSTAKRMALDEVYANAVLGSHANVVRYFSSWVENDYMIIQNEYCNGGSLADVIKKNTLERKNMSALNISQLFLHVAEGLRYIHYLNLVHMDLKPENILISQQRTIRPKLGQGSASKHYYEKEGEITYKLGDLGNVTTLLKPCVKEGDCRYLAPEIFQEDYSALTKADIFAMGMTMYEAGGSGLLPKNGEQWHDFREGKLMYLDNYTQDFNNLLKQMVNPDPKKRPSATELLQHQIVCGNTIKEQLHQELQAMKLKNEVLQKQVDEAFAIKQSTKKGPKKEPTSD